MAVRYPPAKYFADLSGHNTGVDLRAYKSGGHRLLALKLTEGDDFVSDTGVARWAVAKQLGFYRLLGYHFARPSNNSPVAEARHFSSVVKRVGVDASKGHRLVLDWEDPDWRGSKRAGDTWIKEFDRECDRLQVRDPLRSIYSYGPYIARTLTSLPRGWGYWHAAYIVRPTSTVPAWLKTRLWAVQYTNGQDGAKPHELRGTGGPCDVNRLTVALTRVP